MVMLMSTESVAESLFREISVCRYALWLYDCYCVDGDGRILQNVPECCKSCCKLSICRVYAYLHNSHMLLSVGFCSVVMCDLDQDYELMFLKQLHLKLL